MAGQALEKGKPDNGIMWSAGKKHFWNMLLASVLMDFIMVAGLLFFLPAVALQPKSLQAEPQAMGLLLMGTPSVRTLCLGFFYNSGHSTLCPCSGGPWAHAGRLGEHKFLQIQ